MSPPHALLLDLAGVLKVPDGPWIAEQLHRVGLHADVEHIGRAHYLAIQSFDASPIARHRDAYTQAYPRSFIDALGVPVGLREKMLVELFVGDDVARAVALESSVAAVRASSDDGFVVVVVTNNTSPGAKEWLASVGLAGSIQGGPIAAVVESSIVGVAKPNPDIIRHALAAANCADPAYACFVGDSLRIDGQAADGAGVPFVHFDPYSICHAPTHPHVLSLAELGPFLRT